MTIEDVLGPNPLPYGPPVRLQFVRHPLTGLSGPAAVTFDSPPYLIGTANDGSGQLSVLNLSYVGLEPIYTPPRVAYGLATADLNGDGIPDVISGVYSPTNVDSTTAVYFGQPPSLFQADLDFGMNYTDPDLPPGTDAAVSTGFRGRTETLVVADFNNDGAVDVFVPTYTYLDRRYDLSGSDQFVTSGPPPNVFNAPQSYLLLNDGTGHFTEAAVTAGVSMHSALSGLPGPYTDPNGNQPEGAEAVDINMDGLIDLYVGGHMFINRGVDANGIPHFEDMAAQWGLTQTVLRASPTWANDVIPDYKLVTDEGAKFIDWDNSGHLSLLLFRWNWGPAHGARLFEFDGAHFAERIYAQSSVTPTCAHPPQQRTALFWSARPFDYGSLAAGINAYDLNADGLEEVLVSGDSTGSAVFYNYGCGFVEVSAGDLTMVPGGNGGMAFADLDQDGNVDIIYPEAVERAYYDNRTALVGVHSFTVEVLGANGEHNQYGRVLQVFPPRSRRIFTRVVDGGSGYLSQSQYPILIGTPFSGPHRVKVYYAPLAPCTYGGPPCQPAVLTFWISPGQTARTYAPSPAHPQGTAVVSP
ncbi:MAG: VCBS repeat-containing protein [Gammaproteobacteria bacterium]|nr:VCBS repeat-containing protein [Gammaproteobacteria bacterium]